MPIFSGTDNDDIIEGTDESDTIRPGEGNDIIYGRGGDDFLYGEEGNDIIYGGTGNDYLRYYDDGDDEYYGEDGNDRFEVRSTNNLPVTPTILFDGGAGNDYAIATGFGARTVNFIGGTGDDQFAGGGINNSAIYNIDLGVGNDRLVLGQNIFGTKSSVSGQFSVSLGDGQDEIVFNSVPTALIVSDFETGDQGDRILVSFLDNMENYALGDNPFATGHLILVQDGTDTILSIDYDANGTRSPSVLGVFENTQVEDFTAYNFGGYDSVGGAPAPDSTYDFSGESQNFYAGLGDDIITVTGEGNTIFGLDGDDVITGSSGRDIIYGGSGDDIVYGGDGNDNLRIQDGGNDTIHGGNGDDFFRFYTTGSTAEGDGFTVTVNGDAGNDTFSHYDSTFHDVIINGGTGNDSVTIGSSDPLSHFTIDLGADNDSLRIGASSSGGGGTYDLTLGEGRDILWLSTTGLHRHNVDENDSSPPLLITVSDFAAGNTGDRIRITFDDFIANWNGTENPFATGAARLLQVGKNVELQFEQYQDYDREFFSFEWQTLVVLENVDGRSLTAENFFGFASLEGYGYYREGDAGDDTINDTPYNDLLTGNGGSDLFIFEQGRDTITDFDVLNDQVAIPLPPSLSLADVVALMTDHDGYVILDLGSGDTIRFDGVQSADFSLENFQLTDNSGDDTITGTPNADDIDGGAGDDIIDGLDSNDRILGGGGDDLITGGSGDDNVDGGSGNDTIHGNAGNDRLIGRTGDDYIEGGLGDDLIDGGWDNDTLLGGVGNDNINGQRGNDLIDGGDGNDTLYGSSGNDVIGGGAGDDRLYGGGDRDQMGGGEGMDIMYGSNGNDVMAGQNGDDRLYGQNDNDVLIGGNGEDRLDGGNGNDQLYGDSDKDRLFGRDGNDSLYGGDGADRLDGGDGNDILGGGNGDDLMFGGAGRDHMGGDEGHDRLLGGDGNDVMAGQNGNDALFGEVGNDVMLGGTGNDLMEGGDGNDRLYGGEDSDALWGGNGRDTIDGGSGSDMLYGGTGDGFDGEADTFVFSNTFGRDTIADFENGSDVLDFSEHTNFNSLSDVLALAYDSGSNLVIRLNAQNLLILEDMSVDDLDASDFVF